MTSDNTADSATDDTYERGVAMVTEIYQGEVPALPKGTMAFNDVMMRSLFAEVWDRDVLSIRDRRLLIMGVIAARGSTDVWKAPGPVSPQAGRTHPRRAAGDIDRPGALRRLPQRRPASRPLRDRHQRVDPEPRLDSGSTPPSTRV